MGGGGGGGGLRLINAKAFQVELGFYPHELWSWSILAYVVLKYI